MKYLPFQEFQENIRTWEKRSSQEILEILKTDQWTIWNRLRFEDTSPLGRQHTTIHNIMYTIMYIYYSGFVSFSGIGTDFYGSTFQFSLLCFWIPDTSTIVSERYGGKFKEEIFPSNKLILSIYLQNQYIFHLVYCICIFHNITKFIQKR